MQEHWRGATSGNKRVFEVKDSVKVGLRPCSTVEEAKLIMADSKIISGYEDGSFRGNQAIMRKHVASLVNRAKGSSLAVKEKEVDFNDVSRKNPNYHDIRVVQQAGIFSSDSKGNFYPNEVVT